MKSSSSGPHVTAKHDMRITPIGKLLRKTKIDELPELWNIFRGDMSFVGPRPEVPKYVNIEDPAWQEVLKARPGLTDPVTLLLRNEEEILAQVGDDPQAFYRKVLQPFKLSGYIDYLNQRTWTSDIEIIYKTILAVVKPSRSSDADVHELLARFQNESKATKPESSAQDSKTEKQLD